MISTLRAGRASTKDVSSTTFFLDGSFDNPTQFNLQKNLAAIAAYTIPVDANCNKFFLINYSLLSFFPIL